MGPPGSHEEARQLEMLKLKPIVPTKMSFWAGSQKFITKAAKENGKNASPFLWTAVLTCTRIPGETTRKKKETEGSTGWQSGETIVQARSKIPLRSRRRRRSTTDAPSEFLLQFTIRALGGGSWFKCATPQVSCSERKFLWYYTYSLN